MAADDPMMRVRLPLDLKGRIAASAKAANRSMNAEIVARIEASFSPAPATVERERLDRLERAMADLAASIQRVAGQPQSEPARLFGEGVAASREAVVARFSPALTDPPPYQKPRRPKVK
jgi:hypothetical protein